MTGEPGRTGTVLVIAGCAVAGGGLWIFAGGSFACRFGWGGNLCGLLSLITAPAGFVLGALWGLAIAGMQRAGERSRRTASYRTFAFMLWFVPAAVVVSALVFIVLGANNADEARKRSPPDAKLFKATVTRIHAAEVKYFLDHGAFTTDGTVLGIPPEEIAWKGLNHDQAIVGGYDISLQPIFSCTPGSCVMRTHPLVGGERACVTVDGRIIPDSDTTIREVVTTPSGDKDARKTCAPANITIEPR